MCAHIVTLGARKVTISHHPTMAQITKLQITTCSKQKQNRAFIKLSFIVPHHYQPHPRGGQRQGGGDGDVADGDFTPVHVGGQRKHEVVDWF